MNLMMMLVIPIPFIFVLLILLLAKTPKLGVWVIGGLIAAVAFGFLIFMPIAVHDRLLPNILPRSEAIPLVGITIPFLFVLLILLLNKAPKIGAGVIVGVVVMGLFGAFLWLGASRPRAAQVAIRSVRQQRQRSDGLAVVKGDPDRVFEDFVQVPASVDWQPVNPRAAVAAPIWSEGVENEYEADIYPSKLAAVRALGRRMRRPIEQVIADMNTPTKIVLFQNENDGSLAAPFKQAIAETLPDVPCSVLFGSRNIDANEIGITLRSAHVVGSSESLGQQVKATVWASARHRDWEATVRQSFIDKPWMEDFSSFASSNPLQQFIVARSWRTCTSPVEARDQALQDAAAMLQQRIGKKWIIPGVEEALTVGQREVENGGFIVDLFLQSFDGVSGRFWRHAMLIDASPEKLKRLDARMSQLASGRRMSWARMILSALGVLVVIVATYLFLNMATRGYYVWSLRIAGTVLAVMGVISILLVLR